MGVAVVVAACSGVYCSVEYTSVILWMIQCTMGYYNENALYYGVYRILQ
jgi:hypothetical protein